MLKLSEKEDVISFAKELGSQEGVDYAEPNYYVQLQGVPPNDEEYFRQHGLRQINMLRAWDFSTGSANIKVGVIDSGIDYTHPDLGSGAFNRRGAKVRGGWDFFDNDNNPIDEVNRNAVGNSNGHGTKIAGIIGAYRNNQTGIAGIAGGEASQNNPGVQLFSLKVFGSHDSDIGINTPNSSIVAAIAEGSINSPGFGYGCQILNMSFGTPSLIFSMREAVKTAIQNNAVLVVARGNYNSFNRNDFVSRRSYPACYDPQWIISVGAINVNNQKIPISRIGEGIDLVAPGAPDNFWSTTVVGEGQITIVDGEQVRQDYDRTTTGGTSFAAPHVAGVAALLLSVNPNLHHEDVENILKISADDINNPGYDEETGHGRLNAGRALELLHRPYQLQHHTARGGRSVRVDPNWMRNFFFVLQRHVVEKTIQLPPFLGEFHVWSRGANATTGVSGGVSIGRDGVIDIEDIGYCEVVRRDRNSVTLRTYAIYAPQINRWLTPSPADIWFGYTTLGIPANGRITSPTIDESRYVRAFPNPSNGELTLRVFNEEKGDVEVSINDLSGKKIQSYVFTPKENSFENHILDVENLSEGVYLYQVKTSTYTRTGKFIKQ